MIQKLDVVETKNSYPFIFKTSLDKTNDLETTLATLSRVITLTDIVITETNVESLLSYYGLKSDNRSDAAKIKTYGNVLN